MESIILIFIIFIGFCLKRPSVEIPFSSLGCVEWTSPSAPAPGLSITGVQSYLGFRSLWMEELDPGVWHLPFAHIPSVSTNSGCSAPGRGSRLLESNTKSETHEKLRENPLMWMG